MGFAPDRSGRPSGPPEPPEDYDGPTDEEMSRYQERAGTNRARHQRAQREERAAGKRFGLGR